MRRVLQSLTGNVKKKVNARDDGDLSPLHYAARYNHVPAVQLLVQYKASRSRNLVIFIKEEYFPGMVKSAVPEKPGTTRKSYWESRVKVSDYLIFWGKQATYLKFIAVLSLDRNVKRQWRISYFFFTLGNHISGTCCPVDNQVQNILILYIHRNFFFSGWLERRRVWRVFFCCCFFPSDYCEAAWILIYIKY